MVRVQDWEAGDFYREFCKAAQTSPDSRFRQKFEELAKEIEPLDREFCRETSRCGRELASVVDELQSLVGSSGYCRRPRGFADDCEALYADVDKVIGHIRSLREGCFI